MTICDFWVPWDLKGKIYQKLINNLYQIRSTWQEFFCRFNNRPGSCIRYTRVQRKPGVNAFVCADFTISSCCAFNDEHEKWQSPWGLAWKSSKNRALLALFNKTEKAFSLQGCCNLHQFITYILLRICWKYVTNMIGQSVSNFTI